jgi:hypothetical protein
VADDHGEKKQAGSRPCGRGALDVIEQGRYRWLIANIAKIANIANISEPGSVRASKLP